MDKLTAPSPSYSIKSVSEVTPQRMEWYEHNFLPKEGLIILAGPPDMGKSLLTQDVVARASRGALGSDNQPIKSLIYAEEDDMSHSSVHRLKAAGGDFKMIFFFDQLPPNKDLLAAIQHEIESQGYGIVVLDPIAPLIQGDINSVKDVRKVLVELNRFAIQHHCLVIAITHLNKKEDLSDGARIMGSDAFRQVPRVVLMTKMTKNGYVLEVIKNNNGKKASINYQIIETQVRQDNSPEVFSTAFVEYDVESLQFANPDKAELCAALLAKELAKGNNESAVLNALMREKGFSQKIQDKAKELLGVESKQKHRKWVIQYKDKE